jgi:hypothetical protein
LTMLVPNDVRYKCDVYLLYSLWLYVSTGTISVADPDPDQFPGSIRSWVFQDPDPYPTLMRKQN